jgi:hypothetical protein
MLKKNDITGFEKEYLWVDTKNDRVFQFYIDGTGTMTYYADDIDKPIRWEYLGENESPKNTLKIGVDGVIFYFVFKEIMGEEFQVIHKSKTKSETILLSRVVKEVNKKVESSTTEDSQITPEKVKFNLKNMESSDKIFFGFMYVVSLILILVLLKSTSIIGNMSFFVVLLLAIISTTLIFIQLRDVLFFVSQKYKKEIEDIIFKK